MMLYRRLWLKLLWILALVGLLIGAWALPVVGKAAAQSPVGPVDAGLFTAVALSPQPLTAAAAPEIVRQRFVTVDITQLDNPTLQVNPFTDVTWTAVQGQVLHNPLTGSDTWLGRLAGVPYSQVTFVKRGDVVVGKIATADAIYELHYSGQGAIHEVVQIDQSVWQEHAGAVPSSGVDVQIVQPLIPKATAAVSTADDGSIMDILVVYSPEARAGAGGTAAMEATIELAIAETNIAYANSGVNQRVSVVYMYEAAEGEFASMFDDLPNLRNTNDGYIDDVHSLRNEYHADFVVLIKEADEACGLGYHQATPQEADFEDYAFAVVRRGCATGNYSFAHELGHNMGLRHDWFVDANTTPFTDAHGYVNYTRQWRTVMAYNDACDCQDEVTPCPSRAMRATVGVPACTRLIYFSNDSVSYLGDPMGVAAGNSAACLLNSFTPDPSTCDADNEAVLNSNAASNARFRSSQITWLGYSTNWHDANNWEILEGPLNRDNGATSTAVNRLPRAIDNVVIPAAPIGGSFPILNNTAEVRDLLLDNKATLVLNAPLTVYGDLTVRKNAVLDLAEASVTVEGSVSNRGTIRQTQLVTAASDFIMLRNQAGNVTKYYGVQILNPAAPLGNVTVEIRGAQQCVMPTSSDFVQRCYRITPAISRTADIRFYFTEAERNGQAANASTVWGWDGGRWVGVSESSSYSHSESGRRCLAHDGIGCYVQAEAVSNYSFFGLSSTAAIQLYLPAILLD